MIEKLKMKLLQGKYEEAAKMCQSIDKMSVRDMILNIAYDTESICTYSFVQYLIKKTQDTIWIELALNIMLNPLCFVEGAYSVALVHARELLLNTKSIENMERILFFYDIPEKLVDKKEAEIIAKEILKIEPDNKVVMALKL